MASDLVHIAPEELAAVEEDRRGRKADERTIRLFQEALKVRGDTYCYVGSGEVYPTRDEAWQSVAAVVAYARRRDFHMNQRIMPVIEDGRTIGYRAVVRLFDAPTQERVAKSE